jgi:hypothetical protein
MIDETETWMPKRIRAFLVDDRRAAGGLAGRGGCGYFEVEFPF